MSDEARERHQRNLAGIRGATVGTVVGLAVVLIWVVLSTVLHTAAEIQARPDLLRDWPNSRVMEELGDYDQRIDCAEFGIAGMSGYVWVGIDSLGQPTRVLFLCSP